MTPEPPQAAPTAAPQDGMPERLAKFIFSMDWEQIRGHHGRRMPVWENQLPEYRQHQEKNAAAILEFVRADLAREAAPTGDDDLVSGMMAALGVSVTIKDVTPTAQPDAGAEEPVAWQYRVGGAWFNCLRSLSFYKEAGIETRQRPTQPPAGEDAAEALKAQVNGEINGAVEYEGVVRRVISETVDSLAEMGAFRTASSVQGDAEDTFERKFGALRPQLKKVAREAFYFGLRQPGESPGAVDKNKDKP